MTKIQRTCPECQLVFEGNKCNCGWKFQKAFVFEPGEIVVSDVKGKEVALAVDPMNMTVRINGRPTAYLHSFEDVLKHIRVSGLKPPVDRVSVLEKLIEIEHTQAEFINVCAKRIETAIAEKKGGE